MIVNTNTITGAKKPTSVQHNTLSLIHSYSRSLSLTLTLSHPLTHSHSLSLNLSHSLSQSLSFTLPLTLTTHSLITHSLTHSPVPPDYCISFIQKHKGLSTSHLHTQLDLFFFFISCKLTMSLSFVHMCFQYNNPSVVLQRCVT